MRQELTDLGMESWVEFQCRAVRKKWKMTGKFSSGVTGYTGRTLKPEQRPPVTSPPSGIANILSGAHVCRAYRYPHVAIHFLCL